MATQPTLHHSPTDRFLGRCEDCVRPIATDLPDRTGDYARVACPECGRVVQLERVYGCFSSMTCDPRCEGAIGPICECACGGRNHGSSYGIHQEPDALASAVLKHRAQTEVRRAAAAERSARAAEKRAADKARTDAERAAAEAAEQERYESENAGTLSALAAYQGTNTFVLSVQEQAAYGRLSQRQLEAVTGALQREATWATQRAAERQQQAAQAVAVPTGRVTIEGVVHSVQQRDTDFGMVWKMTVKNEAGWRVWSTVPKALGRPESLKGWKVRFTATVKASNDDPAFGFASNPSQASVLDEGVQEVQS